MPIYDNSQHARLLRQTEPYAFQRRFVQIGSNQPRPPQPAIQPNQLRRPSGWVHYVKDYESRTGIPVQARPQRLNWRLM